MLPAITAYALLKLTATAAAAEPSDSLEAAAAGSLAEYDDLCAREAGEMWGVSLCGPMLIVDPTTREAVGNRESPGLTRRGDVFFGLLPPELALANTAIEWGGTTWAMIFLGSLGDERADRLRLMAHESFHRVQPELGLVPNTELSAHLDTADGRYWMQLEWNALERALEARGRARRRDIAAALAFRAARRGEFPAGGERENALEIFEGLAEYTGMRAAGFDASDVIADLDARRKTQSGFVRSFAYVSGPLYGYLLDETGVDWRGTLSASSDLGELLGASMNLGRLPVAEEVSATFDGPALRASEDERERSRLEQLARWRSALIDGSVLLVDLRFVTSGSFDPYRVFPFDDKRTVYTHRKLIAEWGTLTLTDGAILEDGEMMVGRVSLDGATPERMSGPGWTLEPAPGWMVLPAERPGDYALGRRFAGEP